jgi:ABC-2 type transport system permease protein
MTPALVIATKDLRQRVRDRSALVLAVVAPFGLALLLGSVLPEEEDTGDTHTYAVVNEDTGGPAETFVDDVLRGFDKDPGTKLITAESVEAARRLARNDEIAAAFVVPEGFSEAVASNRPAELQVIGNADARIGTLIAEAVAGSYATEVNAVRLATATVVTGEGGAPDPDEAAALSERAAQIESPVTIQEDAAATKELDSKTFYAAGMAVFFLFFTAQYGVLSLLGERRDGTLARLLAAPISPGVIVTAKALSTFVLGVVSMVVLVVATTLALGANWGDPLGVFVLILAGVISAMGITSLVGGLARTDEQAAGYSSIIAVLLGILGGTFFPLSQAPDLLAAVTRITPHYWLMRGFADLSGDGGVVDVVPSILMLVAFGAVLGAVALWRARRMVLRP